MSNKAPRRPGRIVGCSGFFASNALGSAFCKLYLYSTPTTKRRRKDDAAQYALCLNHLPSLRAEVGSRESLCRPSSCAGATRRARCISSRSAKISASRRRTASRRGQGSGGATRLAWPMVGPAGGWSRKYAPCRLTVSPLCTPRRLSTSAAGPPNGSSLPSWQYTSRKAISSRVRIMAWIPVERLVELQPAASNRRPVVPRDHAALEGQGTVEARNAKCLAEFRDRDDARGDNPLGLQEVLVTRDEEIRSSRQRRRQKGRILGIARKIGHGRRAADVHRPQCEQFGPALEGVVVQGKLGTAK